MSTIFKRNGKGSYYIKYKKGERWVRRSLGTESRREALILQKRVDREVESGTPQSLGVHELLDAYVEQHVSTYYPDGGTVRGYVATSVRRVLPKVGVDEFTPLHLESVRNAWIAEGLARSTVNLYARFVVMMFRWGAVRGLVGQQTYAALTMLPALQAGRSGARETEDVHPPAEGAVEAVKPFLSEKYRKLIDLQLLTGARPGELVGLRAEDIDKSGAVWKCHLVKHKNAWRGKRRTLAFGPQAQAILATLPQSGPIFGITRSTYTMTVARACRKAGVEPWSPNQLRHEAATRIRERLGIEAASLVLGHSNLNTTEIYAEKNLGLLLGYAEKEG